jgi:hypothetical protein
MADQNHGQSSGGQEVGRSQFDRELSAALAKYSSAEPRVGLEQRVLANLQAERAKTPSHAWWRWRTTMTTTTASTAAAAAVAIVLIALAWRSNGPSRPAIANHPSPAQGGNAVAAQVATVTNNSGQGSSSQKSGPQELKPAQRQIARQTAPSARQTVAAAPPKLDQFPSPQPLNEQEKILARYVAQFPEHAVLVARARTQSLREDREDEIREASGGNQVQSDNGTTDK